MVSNERGGILVAWYDQRNEPAFDIYANYAGTNGDLAQLAAARDWQWLE